MTKDLSVATRLACRIHGDVSAAPVEWRQIDIAQGNNLQEVLYHKARNEGIAKVIYLLLLQTDSWVRRGSHRERSVSTPYKELTCAAYLSHPQTRHNINVSIGILLQITINRPEKRNAFTPLTGKFCNLLVPQKSLCSLFAAQRVSE